MAKVDFNALDVIENNQNNNSGNDVGFFTLKNDGDEAIVRFMCDSTADFDIQTVHDITVGGKYRKVSCIRDPREPLENCPLCAANTKIANRFFIRLIQYFKSVDANGVTTVIPKAMIWERNTSYAMTLKDYLENYGSLSDIICKVIRHGKVGDMQTTYEIIPNLSKQVFKDEIYVKDTTIFGDFNTLGTFVMNKNYDDLVHFLASGEFPAKPQAPTTATANVSNVNSPMQTPAYTPATPVNRYPDNISTPVEQPVATPAAMPAQAPNTPQFVNAPTATPAFSPNQFGAGTTVSVDRPVRRF